MNLDSVGEGSRVEAGGLDEGGRTIHYWALTILACSQLFYTATLFYSPVYFILIALSPIMIIPVGKVGLSGRKAMVSLGLLVMSYVAVDQAFQSQLYAAYTNFMLGMLSFLYIVSLEHSFSRRDWIGWALLSIKVGGVILLLDTLWRLTHPTHPALELMNPAQMDSIGFYLYKFGGIMFEDSNTTAIASLVLLFLGIYLELAHNFKARRWLWLHVFIVASCISRSAYIASILGILFLYKRKWFWITLVLVLTGSLAIGVQSVIASDGSFGSKFYILGLAFEYIASMNLSMILFGLGLDNSVATFGMYTHILFLTYLVELGLVGTLVMISYWWFVARTSRYQVKFILVPLLISSLSYFFYIGSPFVLIPIGFIVVLSGSPSGVDGKDARVSG